MMVRFYLVSNDVGVTMRLLLGRAINEVNMGLDFSPRDLKELHCLKCILKERSEIYRK